MDNLHNRLYREKMALGKNVKRLREARGLTLHAVAVSVGTDYQNIFNLEKRDSKMSTFAPALAEFFGVRLDRLLSEDFAPVDEVRPISDLDLGPMELWIATVYKKSLPSDKELFESLAGTALENLRTSGRR